MKLIKDPLHGQVSVEEVDLPILDSPRFQRLRRVKQIGLGDLVYPGANHTRFEHSLGAMHMAEELSAKLGFPNEDIRKIRVSALLHDLGHGPLSHTSERFAIFAGGIDHSTLTGREIAHGETAEILSSTDLDPDEIAGIASGSDDGVGRLLHSQVGVDRMDYLIRDAHYTGVAYGVIDHDRIMNTLAYHGGEVVIREKGVQAAESLLVARFLMYPSVYLHHVARIGDSMVLRALEEMHAGGSDLQEIMEMDDLSLMTAMLADGGLAGEMARRILNRDLYKRAVYLPREALPEIEEVLPLAQDRGRTRMLEDDLAEGAGLSAGEVLVDVQSRPSFEEAGIKVLSGDRVEPLEERSALVRSLGEAQWNYWRFGVYCPRNKLESVRRVCSERGWMAE